MSHHPPHVYLDDTWYIITAATLNHTPFLREERAKALLRDKLKELVKTFKINLRAWVILDNHYHLLLQTCRGQDLSRFFSGLHGGTAWTLNEWDGVRGRQVWHNYWDTCIRDDNGYWIRFNYIHQNPVKHGYVQNSEDWRFSSYHYYLRTQGQAWLDDCAAMYPVLDYLEGDDF
ncbi:MAG: transposase [Candidatus Promineifilaceae bacterium]